MSSSTETPIVTGIATMDTASITVRGLDVARDMMGNMDAGQLFYFLVTGRQPDSGQSALTNAMIVSVAEHGMMPSVIAARLTLMGAPESLQGAVASGLLGVGDVYVGPAGNVAHLLQVEAAAMAGDESERAHRIVESYFSRNTRIPGLGHPHHPVDPRAQKLFAMQAALGAPDTHASLMRAIHREACAIGGRHLSLNGAGAIGAVASDIGIEWRAVRGIGLVARTIGLIGHLLEETKQPIARAMWDLVEQHTAYVGADRVDPD